jgi:ribonuclease BN (tRNA processing enzyme)
MKIKQFCNTFSHADHTMGSSKLVKKMNANNKDHKIIVKTGKIFLKDQEIKILHTTRYKSESYLKTPITIARQFEPQDPGYEPIITLLRKKGLPGETENQIWSSVITL